MMTSEEQAYVHSLEKTVKEQAKIIEKQTKLIAKLEARIAELERRLNMNSSNSSKPPSTDNPN